MNVTEWIGFLVSFGLFIYMMIRQALVKREQRKHPLSEEEEQDELRQILRKLDIDEEDEEELPEEIKPKPKLKPLPSPPKPRPVYQPPPVHYETESLTLPSKGERLIDELPQLKNMIIYYEIFGPPKALRKD